MNSVALRKSWNVLCWNVRGINSEGKWESIRNKIVESQCDIVCIQETKREVFDLPFIKLFCPPPFDSFCFLPSVGASGGMLVVWKGAVFSGTEVSSNSFAILIQFTSLHNNESWLLTNIYGSCNANGKTAFLDWFANI